MPFGGEMLDTASAGSGMKNGPYSLPRNPAVRNAFNSSSSPPTPMRWPMSTNAGIASLRGPSVRAMTAPMCGVATVCGGA
jgi:hypothetical protein